MNDPAHNAKVAALAEKLWKLARADCDNNVAIMCAALSTALSVSLREYPTDERKKIVDAACAHIADLAWKVEERQPGGRVWIP